MTTDRIEITSPVAKAIFPHLLFHEEFQGESKEQYSLTLVFKPDDIGPIEKALAQAGGGKGQSPLKLIPDDAKYDPGMYRLRAHTTWTVKAFDTSKDKEPIELGRVSHGSEVRAKLTFVPYPGFGGGVTTYLGNIQLLKEGSSGDSDFGDLPEGYEPGADLDDPLPF